MSRFTSDWEAQILEADDESRGSAKQLRARGREAKRNNPYARKYLRMVKRNIVGSHGFALKPLVKFKTGELNETVNARIVEGWDDYCECVTVDGQWDMVSHLKQVVETAEVDGEFLVRMHRAYPWNRWGLGLEAIDADLLDDTFNQPRTDYQNEVRLGVEIVPPGRRVAYWFLKRPTMVGGHAGERYRVPADQVIHYYDPERINGTRGVSTFHAVLMTMRHSDRYELYELLASRGNAANQAILINEDGDPDMDAGGYGEGDGESGTAEGSGPEGPIRKTVTLDAEPLSITEVAKGFKLQPWDTKHPNAAFAPFLSMEQRKMATGLDVGYMSLFSDPGAANYSSMRGESVQDRDRWGEDQARLIRRYVSIVYRNWMEQALLLGDRTEGAQGFVFQVRDQRQLFKSGWIPRGWEAVDEVKDITSSAMAIHEGLSCIDDELAKKGKKLEDIVKKRQRELKMFADAGVPLGDPAGASAALAAVAAADAASAGNGAGGAKKNGTAKGRTSRLRDFLELLVKDDEQ